METQGYSENDFNSAIANHKSKLLEIYHAGKNESKDNDYYNTHFVKTQIQPEQSKIWSSNLTWIFFNTYTEKSLLTQLTRFEIIKEHCKNDKFEIEIVADLVAKYDALTWMWDYIVKKSYYAINTREVYSNLQAKCSDEKLQLSKELFNEIQNAIEFTLRNKKIKSFINWENDLGGLYDYVFNRYPKMRNAYQNSEFPIPRYIVFHKIIGAADPEIINGIEKQYPDTDLKKVFQDFTIIMLDEDSCFLQPSDKFYDLFFSIELLTTDYLQVENFLMFHLLNSFRDNIHSYKKFLGIIIAKFKRYINNDLALLINQFSIDLKDVKQDELENIEASNKEVTIRKKVLAIKYLLEGLSINNDKIAIADFIKLITGKEVNQKTKDGNIYKMLKKPFPTSDKSLINDLSYIRPYFEKLGLSEIVDVINREINTKDKI